MFSHVMIGTNNIERAKTFYDSLLALFGVPAAMLVGKEGAQQALFYVHANNVFSVSLPLDGKQATPANGATLGFSCHSAEQVQEFHDLAVSLGATSIEDAPGLRQTPMGPVYLAYIRDLDGNKICASYRPQA